MKMNEKILDVINAVIDYGKFKRSHNFIVPNKDFDVYKEMEEYYHSLPLPKEMKRNRQDFEKILQIGWSNSKELERLNNINYEDLHYEIW